MTIRIRFVRGGVRLFHPLDPIPPTAVLTAGFVPSRQVRVFPWGWTRSAARFRPAVVAAPLELLLALARRRVHLGLTHALIVFVDGYQARLTERDRECFWDAFGVPIFEQVLSPEKRLLAAECEAHDGLHIVGPQPGLELDLRPCACGGIRPRLLERAPQLALAAMA